MKITDIFNESVKVTRKNSPKTIRDLLEDNPDKLVDRIKRKRGKTFIRVSPYKFFKIVTEYPLNNQKSLISRGDGVTLFFDGAWTRVFGIVINNNYYVHKNEKDLDED